MKEFLKQLKAVTWRKSMICAVIVLALYTILATLYNPSLFIFGIVIILAYLVAMLFILKRDIKTEGLMAEGSLISGITLDFVMSFRSPVVIIATISTLPSISSAR